LPIELYEGWTQVSHSLYAHRPLEWVIKVI
jgi:hypothetical protein